MYSKLHIYQLLGTFLELDLPLTKRGIAQTKDTNDLMASLTISILLLSSIFHTTIQLIPD